MASAPQASAPSSTVPASSPKVNSEDIISQKVRLDTERVAAILVTTCNAIVKTGIGFSSGIILSVLLFRRRSWPVWLGTGFGLGSGWTDCERSFNPVAIPGVRILPSPHHQSAPSTGTPSVMERLSEKTAGLVDAGKSKGSEMIGAGKAKGSELVSEGKARGNEALDKGKETARQVEDKIPSSYRIHSMQETAPPQDCAACRVIGVGTMSFLSVYAFKEAYQLGFISRRPINRGRGAVLVLFGVASGLGGVYRFLN